MTKEINCETTKIYDYLKTMCLEKSLSREEVRNLLQACLKFVFDVNQIDINNYTILLHNAKPINSKKKLTRLNITNEEVKENEIPPYEICFMIQDEKDLNKYEVFFNSNDTIYKNNTEPFLKNEYTYYPPDTDFENFVIFIYYAFHEFAHIIQYIKYPEDVEIYNDSKFSSYYNIIEYADTLDKKSKKTVNNALKHHMDAKAIFSWFERDANAQAYNYFSILLQSFIEDNDDFTFECYLKDMLILLKKVRKSEFKSYRYANQLNKKAVSTLNEYGISEDELILD